MKVVLFCGGMGMRMRSVDGSMDSPVTKPMMPVGSRPVLWHLMRYYAHFGFTEFILALGYGGESVKRYFLDYDETVSNDFTMDKGGTEVFYHSSDISDWRITFVDTGRETPVGERLRRVRHLLDNDDVFLANYGDVLTDAPMDRIVADFCASDAIASLLAPGPFGSFRILDLGDGNRVRGFTPIASMPWRIDGGYFVLRQEIFDYLDEGEDLVPHGLARAADEGRVIAVPYDGFWAPMDTLKERAALEARFHSGDTPWMLWRGGRSGGHERRPVLEVPDVDIGLPPPEPPGSSASWGVRAP